PVMNFARGGGTTHWHVADVPHMCRASTSPATDQRAAATRELAASCWAGASVNRVGSGLRRRLGGGAANRAFALRLHLHVLAHLVARGVADRQRGQAGAISVPRGRGVVEARGLGRPGAGRKREARRLVQHDLAELLAALRVVLAEAILPIVGEA